MKKSLYLALPLKERTCKSTDEIKRVIAVMRQINKLESSAAFQSRMNTNKHD
jgi:hypothetical protein